ncbi:MAG: hypothetical protein OXQ29_00685 [Rhodospirillaceae bacterium]|nr:hypothetical protein [Rhodospirillaceae bacterium]
MSAIVKEVYDAFRSAGVSDEQATAAARSIPISESLATKADIGDVRAEIGELRTEMGELRTELLTEIGAVRTEMKDLELRMTVKFFTGLGIAVAGVKALDFLIG